MAAAGVLGFAVAGRLLLRLEFALMPFAVIAAVICAYNCVFLVVARGGRREDTWQTTFASFQVGVDVLALTVLMHFGGGIENPFISYYLFHTIIAAILLPWSKVLLQVLFASVCVGVLAIAEFSGVLAHCHVVGFLPSELYDDWRFVMVVMFAFITTLCTTAFLASSVAGRLYERERALARANAGLAEQDRIKSQYVMRVAHDLAEPAAMIASCLKVVTQGLAGPVPEKALDMVQRAEGRSEYLGHLINDLLSLSRIRATIDLPRGDVALADLVSQVLEELQARATAKNLTLTQSIPSDLPPAWANEDAIREVLSNLVTNAVKYTLVDGRVEVSAALNGAGLRVEVRDDGIGIPADALPHVFQEFYRADNVRRDAVEGTGLGLSIVTEILRAHDGRIRVESEEGEGTTFSFTLPTAEGRDA